MSSKQPHWQTYNERMSVFDCGHALWEPGPLSYKRIQLGDVGYIHAGRFRLLFSAGCPRGDRKLGIDVPLTFKPLDVGGIDDREPLPPACYNTDDVKVIVVYPESSSPPASPPMFESFSKRSFKLTGGKGAALVTKYPIYREDALRGNRGGAFEKYTKEHYASWVEFARGGHGDVDPVLVTGVDRTRDFAMLCSSIESDMSCEFATSPPGVSSGWGTWDRTGPGPVYTNHGPQSRCPPPLTPTTGLTASGTSHTEPVSDESNQSVFIRYYTVRKSKTLGVPKVIKAGAGPHDLGGGGHEDGGSPGTRCDPDLDSDSGSDIASSLLSDSDGSSVTSLETESDIVVHNTTTNERDEFDTIADYVFQNSDAKTVLLHHQDTIRLRTFGGSTDLSTRLLEVRPGIIVDGNGVGTIEFQTGASQGVKPDCSPRIISTTPSCIPGGRDDEGVTTSECGEPSQTITERAVTEALVSTIIPQYPTLDLARPSPQRPVGVHTSISDFFTEGDANLTEGGDSPPMPPSASPASRYPATSRKGKLGRISEDQGTDAHHLSLRSHTHIVSTKSQRKERSGVILSKLDGFIQALSLAKDACGILPARIAFGSACVLLTTIKDVMENEDNLIDLGLSCAKVCQTLDRGLGGRRSDELSKSEREAIENLTATVADIQNKVNKRTAGDTPYRAFRTRSDEDEIAAWRQDLNRILHVFNTELVIDIRAAATGIHRDLLEMRDGAPNQRYLNPASIPAGEMPPPAPRVCFGRDELVEEIVRLAENMEPIALIGGGGTGKTSVALSVLHHKRIRDRFGDNRRFICCDQFPASRAHFLARLSEVIGAGVENPGDLAPLRSFLSSTKMFIILDGAEPIFNSEGTNSQAILEVVDELCRLENIRVCITSRIAIVPQRCKHLEIPVLPTEAARDIFYGIYNDGGRSGVVDDLLERLDFHPLSVTLLATTASHNKWSHKRLIEEWNLHRARADLNKSLEATITLSLNSPAFRSFNPRILDLLGVVAFFPQGVNESSIEWLSPAFSDIETVCDKLCALSLTQRSGVFLTMLGPLRDYLVPQDPGLSPLLRSARDHYFNRLSVDVYPGGPGFEEARWIASEDVNVEHLLDIFTSIDATTIEVWDVCNHFVEHLFWHKPRETVLGPKIEALPDDHPSKSKCLFGLSQLCGLIGNHAERKRILTSALELGRLRGDDSQIAQTLRHLSNANRWLGLYEEGVRQAKEALGIHRHLGDTAGEANSLNDLAVLLLEDNQFDAAEDAASCAADLVLGEGQELVVCESHRLLGCIYRSKGETEKAVYHFETAIAVASPLKSHDQLSSIRLALAQLFLDENGSDDANAHALQAKSHTTYNAYHGSYVEDTNRSLGEEAHTGWVEDFGSEIRRRLYENITIYLSDTPPPGTLIPQRPCRPIPKIPANEATQDISFTANRNQWFPARLASFGQCMNLVDGECAVFIGHQYHTINLRIEWPGYDGWSARIRIVHRTVEKRFISHAKLVTEISKKLEEFIEAKKSIPIHPEYARYRVGPGAIELDQLSIAGLERVSRDSWQPRLVYTG